MITSYTTSGNRDKGTIPNNTSNYQLFSRLVKTRFCYGKFKIIITNLIFVYL